MKRSKHYSPQELKVMLDNLLSKAFLDCKCRIDAVYGFSKKRYLFSIRVDGKKIILNINIKAIETLLDVSALQSNIVVCYCTKYIANFVNHVIAKAGCNTDNFLNGLVWESVLYICNCKTTVEIYSPLLSDVYKYRPNRQDALDMLVDVNTLIQMKLQFAGQLLEDEKSLLDELIEKRMLFLQMPELAIGRRGKSELAIYTALQTEKTLAISEESPFYEIQISDDDLWVKELIHKYKTTNDPFLLEILLRVVCFSPKVKSLITDDEMIWDIYRCANLYQENASEYYKKSQQYSSMMIDRNLKLIFEFLKRVNDLQIGSVNRERSRTLHIF